MNKELQHNAIKVWQKDSAIPINIPCNCKIILFCAYINCCINCFYLQREFRAASNFLLTASNGNLYFKDVSILVPQSWSKQSSWVKVCICIIRSETFFNLWFSICIIQCFWLSSVIESLTFCFRSKTQEEINGTVRLAMGNCSF